ncbi:hypothetical protein EV356DRAFT_544813 [Viridothelium virens]|uniref:Rhodopsin domain-containing protein n=1 Tax=Viridothelium virens TaxID=1048519 RepID=A0A6A6HA37_VIRVR|nr:hypothetical protein EV356DRAFT_544813 [Viridothelium virens]
MGWVANATPEQEHASRFPLVISINVVFGLIMTIVVSIRLYIRKQNIRPDDIVAAIGTIFSITFNILCIMQTKYGLGLPLHNRPLADKTLFLRWNYASRPFYSLAGGAFKLALCLSFIDLAQRTTKKGYKKLVATVAVFSTLAALTLLLMNAINCIPVKKIFHPEIPGHCLPYAAYNYAAASIIIFIDVILFLLPIPLIMGLSIDNRLKWQLCVVFSLGLLTTVCSIVRTTYISEVAFGDGDSTMFNLMSALEINVGIIVSCAPHLRPLFIRGARTMRSRSNNALGSKASAYGNQSLNNAKSSRIGKFSRRDSEELILEPMAPYSGNWKRLESPEKRQITKTTQLEVQSELSDLRSDRKSWAV